MTLSKTDKTRIRALMDSDNWQGAESLKKSLIEMWRAEPVKADTDFETLWRVAYNQGKVVGLEDYFKQALDEASSI